MRAPRSPNEVINVCKFSSYLVRAPLMVYTYEGFQFQVYPIGRKQPLKYKFLDFASVKIDAGYYEPTYCVHTRNS